MSVIPLKADIHWRGLDVRLVPEAEVQGCLFSKTDDFLARDPFLSSRHSRHHLRGLLRGLFDLSESSTLRTADCPFRPPMAGGD
jgi:hypothetical protein